MPQSTRGTLQSPVSKMSAAAPISGDNATDIPLIISKSDQRADESFELRWTDLSHSYKKRRSFFSKEHQGQVALQPCCGRVESASVTAILGPSGAGKSTLLDCITGRIETKEGNCCIQAACNFVSQVRRSRIAYLPQTSDFLSLFSVRETLTFASRMNNPNRTKKEHQDDVERLMNTLDMSDKLDWPLAKLSGGQMKRVAIACGLITRPAVIVLDEPTSGLDADNAERLILHLKSLAQSQHLGLKPAVLLTIHSPSVELFRLFDQIYILSMGGYNIYHGSPDTVIEYFESHGFPRARGNPAECCIEIASGKYGVEKFKLMADELIQPEIRLSGNEAINISSMNKPRVTSILQIWLLSIRALQYYFIKAPQAVIRMLCMVSVFVTYFMIQKQHKIGDPLCAEKISNLNRSLFEDTAIATMKLRNDLADQFASMNTIAVFGHLFISNIVYISFLTCMILIILHRPVYRRELSNSWYTATSFFFSRFLVDSITRLFCLTGCALVLFSNTHETLELWRVSSFMFSLYILSALWENIASTVVIVAGEEHKLLELTGYTIVIELVDVLLLDFIAHKSLITGWSLFMKQYAPINNAFNAMMISLFGFNRCQSNEDKAITALSITGNNDPKQALNKVWYAIHVTKKKLIDQLDIMDADEETTAGLYDAMLRWIGPRDNSTLSRASYIIEFFKLQDEQLITGMYTLFIWLGITSVALWYAIRKKWK